MKGALKKTFLYRSFKGWVAGKKMLGDPAYIEGKRKSKTESEKQPSRTAIINYLLAYLERETTYLEIGIRNPEDNYNHIIAHTKYSVDPGMEFAANPADFKMTSDIFFKKLGNNGILGKEVRFDVIFIDGLHLAEQVDRDITNALNYLKEDGFIVLHDCNPPTAWHAREAHHYNHTPAAGYWNGTTWKAFLKWRGNHSVFSCCIDTDWGVGILSKKYAIGQSLSHNNPFYEFHVFDNNRKTFLNLITFDELKKRLKECRAMPRE